MFANVCVYKICGMSLIILWLCLAAKLCLRVLRRVDIATQTAPQKCIRISIKPSANNTIFIKCYISKIDKIFEQ